MTVVVIVVKIIVSTLPAIFKTITVGKSPEGIAVNPETNMVYVANRDLNSTAVIDGKTNKVVANVTVGPSPHSVAVNPNTNLIYVSNRGFPIDNITTTNTDSNTVSVIDGKTNKVVANVTVGYSPEGVAVNPVTNKIYVANSGDYSVSVIDGSNNKVVDKMLTVDPDFGNLPLIYNLATFVAVNPKTNMVYLTNEDADTVSVIDGKNDRMLTSPISIDRIGQPGVTLPAIRVGLQPHGLAVNPETNMIYVPNGDSNSTSVIDGKTNKVVANVTVGNDPHVIAINPKNNMVYVTNFGGGEGITNTVSVIDGNTTKVVANITVGSSPHSVAVNPTTDMVYVTNDDNGTVSVIDGAANNKVIHTIKVGSAPEGAEVNPSTNKIYIGDAEGPAVYVIDGKTNKVVKTIPVGITSAEGSCESCYK